MSLSVGNDASVNQTHAATADLESVNLDEVNPFAADELETAAYALQDRLDDLQKQFDDTSDPDLKMELRQEMQALEDAFDTLKDQAIELTSEFDGSIGEFKNEKMAPELLALVDDFRQVISESYAEFGTADLPPASFNDGGGHTPIECRLGGAMANLENAAGVIRDNMAGLLGIGSDSGSPEVVDTSSASDASSVSDSSSASDSSSGGVTADNVDVGRPDQMLELFDQDPEAFYDALMEIPQGERMEMLTFVQGQIQQMNQLFSMISQFSQSMHDTSKAAINNMRV